MIDAAKALARILAGQDLSSEETEELFDHLMDGNLSEAMKAALLVGLAGKGECADEIAGAAAAMRSRVIPIPTTRSNVIDTCGTGGDGSGSFNISTAAAIVASAAGAMVAKHGNRSISSKSGSADVLEALGVRIQVTPDVAARVLDRIGIAFLFAPGLHPAMSQVMSVRRELGVRTIFNILGPLTNPAGAKRQVLGVFSPSLVETAALVLLKLGSEHAMVVHGSDGLDELTTTGETWVAELSGGRVRTYEVEPEQFGLRRAAKEDLAGGTPDDNAQLMKEVLSGRPGPLSEITALNAGAAIYISGLANDLPAGVVVARRTLDSGAGMEKLAELREAVPGEE